MVDGFQQARPLFQRDSLPSSWQNFQVVRSPTSGVPLALPLSPSVHSAEVDSPTATHERLSCLDRGVWKAVAMPVGALPMLWDDSQESGRKKKVGIQQLIPKWSVFQKPVISSCSQTATHVNSGIVVLEKTTDLPIESKCNARYPKFQMHVSSF